MPRIVNMMLSTPMLVSIVGATLAHYAIGSVWFVVLKKPYLAGLGKTPQQMQKGPSILQASLLHLLCALVTAFILQWIITVMNAHGPVEGMRVAAVIWLGFIGCVMGPMYAYQAYSLRFFLINGVYQLLGLLAMGAVLGLVC